ncbi:MAG: family 10 glycosylhydrolase [Ignavibacteriales bacterium]|nr:family 10 glycosylhydrolase [Ignavibacteriales bacterium]
MRRREIIKSIGLGTLFLATNQLLPSKLFGTVLQSQKKDLKNWAWISSGKGKDIDYWKKKLENAKANGIDSVLLEVYNSRVAFYDTDRFPVEEDILSKFIPLCKSIGLELHAWMWTMPCNVDKIVKEHPEWYVVNGKGEPACEKPAYVDYYKFLCPCNEEAQEFIRGNVESLAKINEIDGVHLDYVRLPDVIIAIALQPKYGIVQDREYPQYDYSYSKSCREQFKAKSGIDPLTDLTDPSANKEWRQFRYDSVTNLVNDKLVPTAKKYNKKISAAVFPNWENVRQDWKNWDLDCYMPMLYHNFYNKDISWIAECTHKEINELKNPRPLYSGLFIPELTATEIKIACTKSVEAGASGISIFDLNSMDEEKWSAFKMVSKLN